MGPLTQLGSAGLAAALSLPAAARASCAEPSPNLAWSYPAQDAVDVPINAHFWLVTTISGVHDITLDGQGVSSSSWSFGATEHWPGEDMEPDTEYVLRFSVGSEEPQGYEVRFTTGSERAEPPAEAPQAVLSTDARTLDAGCGDVIQSQDCFDTGQSTTYSLETAVANPVGFTVSSDYLGSSTVWPDGCGDPAVFAHAPDEGGPQCFELRTIGEGGLLSEPSDVCLVNTDAGDENDPPDPDAEAEGEEDDTPASEDGCSTAGGEGLPSGAWALLALLGLARTRRT